MRAAVRPQRKISGRIIIPDRSLVNVLAREITGVMRGAPLLLTVALQRRLGLINLVFLLLESGLRIKLICLFHYLRDNFLVQYV